MKLIKHETTGTLWSKRQMIQKRDCSKYGNHFHSYKKIYYMSDFYVLEYVLACSKNSVSKFALLILYFNIKLNILM